MGESMLSVGIDVGTSTTQLIVSRLTVENQANAYSVPDLQIKKREILYRSPIHFTPLLSETTLDAAGIETIVAKEYQSAHIVPEEITTGAIIITGETARKENAKAVLDALEKFAGDFVVATAGPDLESILAAKGAGVDLYSAGSSLPVLHMDIGGGTSNLALAEDGVITKTGCLNVGGRLIRMEHGIITYVSPVLSSLSSLRPGDAADPSRLEAVVAVLVNALESAAGLSDNPVPPSLITNRLFPLPGPVILSFSGGVADLIENTPENLYIYGDIGPMLGRAIKHSRLCSGSYRLGAETIRATVIGAGCHSTQLSGSTVYAREIAFPLESLPVLCLTSEEQEFSSEMLRSTVESLKRPWPNSPAALFLPGFNGPSYDRLQALADRLADILTALPAPHVVVTGYDMAKALGHALASRLRGPLLCLDGLELTPESFLDIAPPVAHGAAFPVVKKTLVLG